MGGWVGGWVVGEGGVGYRQNLSHLVPDGASAWPFPTLLLQGSHIVVGTTNSAETPSQWHWMRFLAPTGATRGLSAA